MLALDKDMELELENFAQYYSSMGANNPFESSKFLTLLGPGNNIVTNYIDSESVSAGTDNIVNKLKFKTIKEK